MPGNAPVTAVGGTQDDGPWPSEIEQIAEDDRLHRPVTFQDGSRDTVQVDVTDVQQIRRVNGTETDGYVVGYQYEDPTLGGVI